MEWKKWGAGDPVTINRIVWGEHEFENVKNVFWNDWFGPGVYCKAFEIELAKYLRVKHVQLVNSGSSALLLGTKALQELGKWSKDDLILHPLCTFPTSCNPIWQTGMTPVFVDVDWGTYNIDIEGVAFALEKYPRIKGAIIPHLLGNSPQMDKLIELLDGRPLIEDCCDTMGSKYDGELVGTFGDVSATSFYGSHHITTAGVGGALFTNNRYIYKIANSMTFWGREPDVQGDEYTKFEKRYHYVTLGYDMQMSEIQAAFGLAQLSDLEGGNQKRKEKFDVIDNFFLAYSDWFILPRESPKADPSWFGYPLTIEDDAPFTRRAFVEHLYKYKIEVRPLFTGNLTRHLAYRNLPYIVAWDKGEADRIGYNSLFLPAWGELSEDATNYMFEVIEKFLRLY